MKNSSLEDLNYGFVGLGLMGGSFAKAIREKILCGEKHKGKLFAMDKNISALETAYNAKIIDSFFSLRDTAEMLALCDITFVCLYPKSTLEFLIANKDNFKKGSILTDIAGVKTEIITEMDNFLKGDVDYICGHPMAGSEKEGLQNSRSEIFNGRNYILMPQDFNKPENMDLFKKLITRLGFSRITETDFKDHDHKIAFTSQLCHVIASALVDSAESTTITAFGGGSFEDLTRIAMINAPLWTELFFANREELLSHIDNFERSLDFLKKQIKDADSAALCEKLSSVRDKRVLMSNT
jgi:prephenate dehydrogenase